MSWKRLNGQRIELPIKEAVEQTIIAEQAAGYRLKICIGTDSAAHGDHIEFATVIVFLRENEAALCLLKKRMKQRKCHLKNG